MLPASYGFSWPPAKYKISLPLNKIGDCKFPRLYFYDGKLITAFHAATHSSLLLKTRKFVLSLNKTVLDLQSKNICTEQNNIAKIIYKIVSGSFNLKQLHCIIYNTRTIQYILFNSFYFRHDLHDEQTS
jgi:hypothetical protein